MILAEFSEPVKTSELEKALSNTLSDLGYKIKTVKDNSCSKEYIEGKFVPIKEGVEYEVKRGFLEPKIYVGFKFELAFEQKLGKFRYKDEMARQLYGSLYSVNKSKHENSLLEIIKTTINEISKNPEMGNKVKITYYE